VRRRKFLGLVCGVVAAWPLGSSAQQAKVPVVGFLSGRSPEDSVHVLAAFRRGLRESGFVDGHNVTLELRWARGRYDELPPMTADLVNRQVDVLVAVGGAISAQKAVKLSTTAIPVVFVTGSDPIKAGLVKSFNRPGGNITGSVILGILEMEPKKFGLLRELVPGSPNIGAIIDPNFYANSQQLKQIRESALKVGQHITVAKAGNDSELDDAFTTLAREQVSALLIASCPYFDTRQDRFIAFATKHRLPAMYHFREFADAGGLISYGPSFADAYRQAGAYTGRILKGAQPGDLPVVQSSRFEMVINLKVAKSIGLTIPHTLLARADEVIE
jgi:putative ABC transport system substrate-binding protein